jgi:anti-sigma-K factor RskA/putative zinc finger protein
MSTPAPDHERWADAVGSYLLGALPPEEREGFAAHLEVCPVCRRDADELAIAADALPISVPPIAPPPALKDRIMTVVESEAELLAAAGEGADAPRRAPARTRRRFLGGWLLRPGVAVACAAVLLVAGGVVGALLAGGESTRTVTASTTAPGAQVRLEVRDDASMLVVRNLREPPPGRMFQVWIKRPGRDPEPTSVLWSPRNNGSAEVAVPGSLDGVEAVLVTDEPRGGSEKPTRQPVITAPLA